MFNFMVISIFRNLFLSFVFSQGIRGQDGQGMRPQQEGEQGRPKQKNKTKIEGNPVEVQESGTTPPLPIVQ